jgi:ribose transport system permease protein
MNILEQASIMAIMVLGVTWVIGADEMDASFPDIAACASMIFAALVYQGVNIYVAIVGALVVGGLLGVITSIAVVRFKFHSLITTIAVATIAKSVAAAMNAGMPIPLPGIKSSFVHRLVNAKPAGIPVILIFAIGLYVFVFIIQEKTRFGQYIYALGENRQAVKETGIRSHRVLSAIFILSAIFAALAGVLTVFMVYGSGQPKMGSAFFLDGFTTVFLGAMIMKLGKTNVVGTFAGACLLAVLVNGLTMIGASFATSQIIKGVLLVIGVVIVSMAKERRVGKVGVLKYE